MRAFIPEPKFSFLPEAECGGTRTSRMVRGVRMGRRMRSRPYPGHFPGLARQLTSSALEGQSRGTPGRIHGSQTKVRNHSLGSGFVDCDT